MISVLNCLPQDCLPLDNCKVGNPEGNQKHLPTPTWRWDTCSSPNAGLACGRWWLRCSFEVSGLLWTWWSVWRMTKGLANSYWGPAIADRALAIGDPSKDVVVDLLADHLVLVPQQDQFSFTNQAVWLWLSNLLNTKWWKFKTSLLLLSVEVWHQFVKDEKEGEDDNQAAQYACVVQ